DAGAPRGGGGIPAGGGYGGGGYGGGGGGFKKGGVKPLAILLGILAVGGGAAVMLIRAEAGEKKNPIGKAAQMKKALLILPTAEQVPQWRQLTKADSSYLKQEALKHLAWANDPEGVGLAAAALADLDQGVRAQAATALTEYGSPAADSAKPALLK